MDGDVEVGTKLDTSGLDKGIKDMKVKLDGAGKSVDKSMSGTDKFNKVLGKIAPNAAGAASELGDLALAGGPYVAAAVAAVAVTKKYVEALGQCNEAFEVQEKAEKQLAIAAQNNPYLTDESVESLKKFASELQNVSEIGDETSLKIMANLASTGRTQDQIEAIMKAAADYSAATGTDIATAAQTLNATYSGMAGQLGRQLGTVKDLTEEQLKNGDAVKAVAAAYKGVAANISDAGAQAKNAKGDFEEAIGSIVNPTAELWSNFWKGFYEKGIDVVHKISEALQYANQHWVIGGGYQSNKEYVNSVTGSLKDVSPERKTDYLQANAESLTDDSLQNITSYIENKKKQTEGEKEFLSILKDEENHREKVAAADKLRADIQQKTDNMSVEDIQKRLDQLEKEKGNITANATETGILTRALQKKREEQEKGKKTADDYATENNKALEANITAIQTEAKAKGESASAQDIYNAYLQSYIDLLSKTEGKIKEGYPIEDKRKKQLEASKAALDAETDSQKKLEKAIDATKQVQETIAEVSAKYAPAFDADNAIKKYEELKTAIATMSDEQIAAEQKGADKIYTKAELIEGLNEAETVAENTKNQIKEKSDDDYIKEYQSKQQQLLNDKNLLESDEVANHKDHTAELSAIDQQYADNKKKLWQDTVSQINQYTQQATQTAQDAGALMLESVQNESKLETAALEEKYTKGEISEEEYTEKKAEIDKKAAKEEYKIKMFEWTAQMLSATANIAEGVSKAIAQGGVAGIITGALVSAAGAVQLASIIASKPVAPSFSTGGIVGGTSYSGDNIQANVNSGEAIFTLAQQRQLWEMANGRGSGNGDVIVNNTESNHVSTQVKQTNEGLVIDILDKHINKSISDGTYDGGFAGMNNRQNGTVIL